MEDGEGRRNGNFGDNVIPKLEFGNEGGAAHRAAATGEEIFHDLVEFFFDEAKRRNMLLSR
jgi:hypothetical protein